MLRRNKTLLALAIVAVVLIAVRAALPSVVKDYVNRTLHGLEAYDGNVEDIDLALWRGAYRIDGIRVVKRGAEQETPFFDSERVDLSVEWRSLLSGSLVSEVVFVSPVLNLVQEKSEKQSQLGKEEDWQAQLDELFPFRFNTIEIRNGTVTFVAPGIQTKDALKAQGLNGTLTNLTNVADANKETFAQFDLAATVLDDAPARVHGSLDPWAKQPTFDVNLEVKQVALPKVNPWLRQYIKADAESGDFELFLEIAAAEGKFKGYAKPIMRNVNITSSEEKEESPLRKLWEGVVEFAANVFENDQEDQVAARVPFTGTIENPEASIWPTIVSVIRNAFVSAFARSLEGSISLRDVKKNLGQYAEDDDAQENKKNQKDKDAKESDKRERTSASKFGPRSTG
jgi:Domain of Unknown Function (DUF748)